MCESCDSNYFPLIQANSCNPGSIPGCLIYKDNMSNNNNEESGNYSIECQKCIYPYFGNDCSSIASCLLGDNIEDAKRCSSSDKCLSIPNWPNIDFSLNSYNCTSCEEGYIYASNDILRSICENPNLLPNFSNISNCLIHSTYDKSSYSCEICSDGFGISQSNSCVSLTDQTNCKYVLLQEFKYFSEIRKMKLGRQNLCYSDSGQIHGSLVESVTIDSSITYANSEIVIDTVLACKKFGRDSNGLNIVYNKGTASSTLVSDKHHNSNSVKYCIQCDQNSIHIVDDKTPKNKDQARSNFFNIYNTSNFDGSLNSLGINILPFGGDYHFSCMNKSRISSTSILGNKNSSNEIENCDFYGLFAYRLYLRETEPKIGLGCVKCSVGYTGAVFSDAEYQFINNQETLFLEDCSISITDYDSSKNLKKIGLSASISEPLKYSSGNFCTDTNNIMVIYTKSNFKIKSFNKNISSGQTMEHLDPTNSSSNIQECLTKSSFTNLPGECLVLNVFIDIAKNYDYSSSSRSFNCIVCKHGYKLSQDGDCEEIMNCDKNNVDYKDDYYSACGECAAGFALTFYNNNGNSAHIDQNNLSDFRYNNLFIYSFHVENTRDIFNDERYDHISEVDYTTCHSLSSHSEHSNCKIYDFKHKKCVFCRDGFRFDSFGICSTESDSVGCTNSKRTFNTFTYIDDMITLGSEDSTSSDINGFLMNDLQALMFYSIEAGICESCKYSWSNIFFLQDKSSVQKVKKNIFLLNYFRKKCALKKNLTNTLTTV